MKVLITGANGFIASGLVEALLEAGHSVVACARLRRNLPDTPRLSFVGLDVRDYLQPQAWQSLVDGVDAVINCAGILRGRGDGEFEQVHFLAPQALARACQVVGNVKFIQLSALGSSADGLFVSSKHRFDDWLLASGLPATVVRPSVVVSLRGSYGGTSMLRALAALPGVLAVPGRGDQRIQPVLLEDLADLVMRCLPVQAANGEVIYAAGPAPLTLREYLLGLRSWLKFSPPRLIELPLPLVRFAAAAGERFGKGPLGKTITGMLERGNVAPDGALDRAATLVGWRPRSVAQVFTTAPSFVQDRWHARLYLTAPLVWLSLVLLWLMSGISGLFASPSDWQPVVTALGVPPALRYPLVVATSVLDLLLAAALILMWRMRLVLWLMLLSVVAYTVLLGVLVPQLWLEPLGGMIKNLPVAALLVAALILEDGR